METCGVLSGSMIVIGQLFGRRRPGESWDEAADLGAAIRNKFFERHSTSTCSVLRERFGEEQQLNECRELVRTAVSDLLDFLQSESCAKIIADNRKAAKDAGLMRDKEGNTA